MRTGTKKGGTKDKKREIRLCHIQGRSLVEGPISLEIKKVAADRLGRKRGGEEILPGWEKNRFSSPR